MRLRVNGELLELQDGATVADLVEHAGGSTDHRRGVAVAVDAEVVPRSAWHRTELSEGQSVELLTAMQGG
jgi:sulfur carrier protein